jgi:hypothetical protein
MQPINYTIQAPDPTEAFARSFQLGSGIRQLQQQAAAQEMAQQQQRQVSELIQKTRSPNATASDYANLAMMLGPEQAKSVRENFAMMKDEKAKAALQRGGQVFSALSAGDKDVATQLIDEEISAMERDGNTQGVPALKLWREKVQTAPQEAMDFFGLSLSMMPGGEKVIDSALKQRKAPMEMAGLEVDNQLKQAEIGLKNAETSLKIAEAAAKRAESAGGKSEESQLKLEKARLDLQEARNTAAEKKLQKDYEGKDAILKLDTAIGTVDRILKHPQLDDVVGMTDQWMALGESERKVATDIDTLKSQAFLAQLPGMRGFGALSEGDRLALTTAIGNINRGVSEKDFRNELKNIKTIFNKMKTMSSERYGIEGESPASITVGGKTYTRPANFTDEQWAEYKTAVGAK